MNHILAVSSPGKMMLLTQLAHPFLSSLHAVQYHDEYFSWHTTDLSGSAALEHSLPLAFS